MTDDTVVCDGKRLCGPEPLLEAQRKLQGIPLQDHTLYVLCSPLHGSGIKDLLRRLPGSSVLATVECDYRLARLFLEQHPPAPQMPETAKAIVPVALNQLAAASGRQSPAELTKAYLRELSCLFSKGIRRLFFFSFHGGRQLHGPWYADLEANLEIELRRYWRNLSTTLYLGQNWVRNSLVNLAQAWPISPLPCLSGHPLAVFGAGPSLDASLDQLQRLPSGTLILAVDTVLPALLGRGIQPDFLVVLESQSANLADFVGCALGNCHVLADLSAHTGFMSGNQPRALSFFASVFTPSQWWPRLGQLCAVTGRPILQIPPLGSVGLAALYLAGLMKPDTIHIFGLDFSYEPGKSHARGCPSLTASLTHSKRLSGFSRSGLLEQEYRLPGHHDPVLISTDVLGSYGADARLLLEQLQQQGRTILDCRSRGLDLGLLPGCTAEASPKRCPPGRPEPGPAQENPAPPSTSRTYSGEPASQFLHDLASEIHQCLGLIDQVLEGREDLGARAQAALDQLDFLILRIPPHRRSGQGYLIQAKIHLWYFSRQLEKMLAP